MRSCVLLLLLAIQSNAQQLLKVGHSSVKFSADYTNFCADLMLNPWDDAYLFCNPKLSNTILKINLKDEEVVEEIDIPYGENHAMRSEVRGFDFDQEGHLLLAPFNYPAGLFRRNLDESIERILEIREPTGQIPPGPYYLNRSRLASVEYVERDEFILIPQLVYNPNLEVGLRIPCLVIFDKLTGRLCATDIRLPEDITDLKRFAFLDITLINSPLGPLMAFSHSPYIYILNSFNDPVTKVSRSKFENFDALKMRNSTSNEREIYNYRRQSFFYGSLYYDKWRDIYYRIVKLPGAIEGFRPQDRHSFSYSMDISIMILDNQLNVVDEFVLDNASERYSIRNMFVGPGGLYISTSNPYSSDYREDYLEFDIFQYDHK